MNTYTLLFTYLGQRHQLSSDNFNTVQMVAHAITADKSVSVEVWKGSELMFSTVVNGQWEPHK